MDLWISYSCNTCRERFVGLSGDGCDGFHGKRGIGRQLDFVVVAEFMAVLLSAIFLHAEQGKYRYRTMKMTNLHKE